MSDKTDSTSSQNRTWAIVGFVVVMLLLITTFVMAVIVYHKDDQPLVGTDDIADKAVTMLKLADDVLNVMNAPVDTARIEDGAITAPKLASEVHDLFEQDLTIVANGNGSYDPDWLKQRPSIVDIVYSEPVSADVSTSDLIPLSYGGGTHLTPATLITSTATTATFELELQQFASVTPTKLTPLGNSTDVSTTAYGMSLFETTSGKKVVCLGDQLTTTPVPDPAEGQVEPSVVFNGLTMYHAPITQHAAWTERTELISGQSHIVATGFNPSYGSTVVPFTLFDNVDQPDNTVGNTCEHVLVYNTNDIDPLTRGHIVLFRAEVGVPDTVTTITSDNDFTDEDNLFAPYFTYDGVKGESTSMIMGTDDRGTGASATTFYYGIIVTPDSVERLTLPGESNITTKNIGSKFFALTQGRADNRYLLCELNDGNSQNTMYCHDLYVNPITHVMTRGTVTGEQLTTLAPYDGPDVTPVAIAFEKTQRTTGDNNANIVVAFASPTTIWYVRYTGEFSDPIQPWSTTPTLLHTESYSGSTNVGPQIRMKHVTFGGQGAYKIMSLDNSIVKVIHDTTPNTLLFTGPPAPTKTQLETTDMAVDGTRMFVTTRTPNIHEHDSSPLTMVMVSAKT
jgi:hypothetical protein